MHTSPPTTYPPSRLRKIGIRITSTLVTAHSGQVTNFIINNEFLLNLCGPFYFAPHLFSSLNLHIHPNLMVLYDQYNSSYIVIRPSIRHSSSQSTRTVRLSYPSSVFIWLDHTKPPCRYLPLTSLFSRLTYTAQAALNFPPELPSENIIIYLLLKINSWIDYVMLNT